MRPKPPTKLEAVYYWATRDQLCSVEGCHAPAAWTVALVDFYEFGDGKPGEWFFEQDFTCPFLCHTHREINDQLKNGRPGARGGMVYPFTNRDRALGWSAYLPISVVRKRPPHERGGASFGQPGECCVCGGDVRVQLHHFAPRALFEDADDWPQAYLCIECHMRWHVTLKTPHGNRRAPR